MPTGFSVRIRGTLGSSSRNWGEEDIYSAPVGLDYRALAVMRKGRVVWYWIGSHAQYNRLV